MSYEKYLDGSQPYGLTEEIRLVVMEEMVKALTEKLKSVLPKDDYEKFHKELLVKMLARAFEHAETEGGNE